MDKREKLLEAALQLILTEGYATLTIKKLGKEAGVALGTLYLYFASKEQLFVALHQTIIQQLQALVLQGYAADRPFKANFWQVTHNILAFYAARPDCFSFLQQYRTSPLLGEQTQQQAQLLAPVYAVLAEARHQRLVKNLPTELLVALVSGPINAFMQLALEEKRDAHDPGACRQLQEACWLSIAT